MADPTRTADLLSTPLPRNFTKERGAGCVRAVVGLRMLEEASRSACRFRQSLYIVRSCECLLMKRTMNSHLEQRMIDFSLAVTKHLGWRMRTREFLDGKKGLTLAEVTSPRDCELG